MIRKSYAKINFSIDVVRKLDNGYHELDMIMAKINLFDKLYFSQMKEDAIKLTCTNKFIPVDNRNLVYKVIERVKERFNIQEGIRVHIIKMIPTQAGLGGGSSNAAVTLDALNDMFNLNMNLEDKIEFIKDLGSDIPFFFYNSICRVQGEGELITPITSNLSDFSIALVKPQRGVSTKLVYENLDIEQLIHPDIDGIINAIAKDDYPYLVNNIKNSLEASSIMIRPVIQELKDELMELGADCTLVCGSGSTIFALSKNAQVIKRIKSAHKNKKNFVYVTKLKTV